MRNFPSAEALVAAYWRKLASSMGAAYRTRDRVDRGAALRRVRVSSSAPKPGTSVAQTGSNGRE